MKHLLILMLRPVHYVLQIIIPVRQRRVFYYSKPDFTDNSYFVFRHLLLTRSNIEHVWLIVNAENETRIREEFTSLQQSVTTHGNRLRVVRTQTLSGYLLFLTSRYSFHSHGIYSVATWAFRREVINLWHGMPIKCIGRLNKRSPNPYPTFGTLHIATSHFFKYIIASAFSIHPNKVQVCGMPRCDALQPDAKSGQRDDLRQKLDIGPETRLLLWMPTYRVEHPQLDNTTAPHSFLNDTPEWVMQRLSQAAEKYGLRVLVKLHRLDPLNNAAIDQLPTGITLLRSDDWLKMNTQLYELIAASDALMSDLSSVLIDYLVTNRPMAATQFSQELYTRDLVFPMETLLRSQRISTLNDPAALEAFLQKTISREQTPATGNDISNQFYEHFAESGCETLARRLGL